MVVVAMNHQPPDSARSAPHGSSGSPVHSGEFDGGRAPTAHRRSDPPHHVRQEHDSQLASIPGYFAVSGLSTKKEKKCKNQRYT